MAAVCPGVDEIEDDAARHLAVLKPIDGAGSQDTYLVRAPHAFPEQARTMPVALLQALVPGVAHSASFLMGRDGRIAKIWRSVSVDGHADSVLAAASAL